MLIREALAQGSADLKYADNKTPGLDASLLLAHVLNTNRTSLIIAGNDKLSEKNCAAFCELIERRANGECVAYIIGKKEFRGLEFTVNKSVLVPRPDTEILVEAAIALLSADFRGFSQSKILDLCTGSGAVAISLKHEMPQFEVYATDICKNALDVAKNNAEKLLGKNQIQFFHGDLFDALPPLSSPSASSSSSSAPLREFFLITSNPPYIPTEEIQTLSPEVQNEPQLALDGGNTGLEIIKRIIDEAPNYLTQGGVLLLEADPRQMENINIMLDKNGFNDIKLYNDLSGSKRVISGVYEK